jgi:uncharacterized protein YlxW (UPF0749 family)
VTARTRQQVAGTGPSRSQAAIALVALGAAFLVVLQVRTETRTRRLLGISSPRLAELAYRMQQEEQQRVALETEIVRLRERIAEMTVAAGDTQRALETLSTQIRTHQALAGFTALEGPGILIEMSDNPRPLRAGENPNDVLLHSADLARIVADLWAAGAEALTINDERFTATSGIECVGTTVLVNQRRIVPPFRIAAIGDPDVLVRGIARPGGNLDMLKAFGFPIRIERREQMVLPPYRGVIASAIP